MASRDKGIPSQRKSNISSNGPAHKKVRNMDQNDDGRVSRDEFRGPPQAFSQIDNNGDGFLTVQEFKARIAKVKSGSTATPRKMANVAAEDNVGTQQSKLNNKILSEEKIRSTVIGNTLNFISPGNGRNLFVYFNPDGRVLQKPVGGPRIITKKWFINKKAMLCRTFGKQNKNHCTKVEIADLSKLSMFNQKVRYEAKLLKGKNLPK